MFRIKSSAVVAVPLATLALATVIEAFAMADPANDPKAKAKEAAKQSAAGAVPPPLVVRDGDLATFALSPDGMRLAIATRDNFVRVVDLDTEREISRTKVHPGAIPRIAFSPDGKRVIAYCDAGFISAYLWEAATGKLLKQVGGEIPRGRVLALACSRDGKWFVVGRSDNWAMRYEADTGSQNGGIAWDNAPVVAVTFSTDSRFLVAADQAGTVRVEDWVKRDQSFQWKGHGSAVTALALSEDGKVLASADVDGTLCLWELASRKRLHQWAGHKGAVRVLTFLPDKALLSTGDDGAMRLWDADTAKPLRELPLGLGEGSEVAVSQDGKWLGAAGADGRIRVWAVEVLRQKLARNLELTQRHLDEFWADLACNDAVRRFRAMATLTSGAAHTLPFLRKQLKPEEAKPVPADVVQLLADLDSPMFAVRDKANRELEKRGKTVEKYLRGELAKNPPLEVSRRLTGLLDKLGPANLEPLPPDQRRVVLAVRVLEHIGTPEARGLLARLAEGAADAEQTRQAEDALQRLKAASGTR